VIIKKYTVSGETIFNRVLRKYGKAQQKKMPPRKFWRRFLNKLKNIYKKMSWLSS
jgi:hypothetical protein